MILTLLLNLNDIDDIDEIIKNRKILIIVYGMIADILSHKKRKQVVTIIY